MREVRKTKENPPLRILTHGRELECFGPKHDSRKVNERDPVTGLYESNTWKEVRVSVRLTDVWWTFPNMSTGFLTRSLNRCPPHPLLRTPRTPVGTLTNPNIQSVGLIEYPSGGLPQTLRQSVYVCRQLKILDRRH